MTSLLAWPFSSAAGFAAKYREGGGVLSVPL